MLGTILGLLILSGILSIINYFTSKISGAVTERQENKKKQAKFKEARLLQDRRIAAKTFLPRTHDNYYPILLQAFGKDVDFKRYSSNDYYYYEGYCDDIVGISEKKFYKDLVHFFGKEQTKHNSITIKIGKYSFTPDFTYIDEINKVFVCIEIDEPYVYNTKEPIHYDKVDGLRNTELRKCGWNIIRFSEKQAVLEPDECCKFIAEYLSYIYINNKKMGILNIFNDVTIDKCWTKSEAEKMAYDNYRKTYLPK